MRDLLFRLRTKSSLVPKMLKSVRICASSSSQCSLSDSKRSMRPQQWMKWPSARSTWSVVLHVGDRGNIPTSAAFSFGSSAS